MYRVSWKRLSDGKAVRTETYDNAEEAIAEAKEPVLVVPAPVYVDVTDDAGAVIFTTASDNA